MIRGDHFLGVPDAVRCCGRGRPPVACRSQRWASNVFGIMKKSRLAASTLSVVALTIGSVTGIGVAPASATEVSVVINNITYTADDRSPAGATVTSHAGTGGAVVIPARVTIGGNMYDVTTIGPSAFEGDRLTSVTIPNGVTSIGANAFSSNWLGSVVIPASVTAIGDLAFNHSGLSTVSMSTGLQTIGEDSFSHNSLKSITIPNSVTSIGISAFYDNELASVTIPSSVETIGGGAFSSNLLTSVTISSGVTEIGSFAFHSNQLTSVTIPNSVEILGGGAFRDNMLTSVKISTNVSTIEYGTFWDNRLKSVTIPSSVRTIENTAFYNNQLTSVSLPSGIESIGDAAFANNLLSSVTIPSAVDTIGCAVFDSNPMRGVLFMGGAPTIRVVVSCEGEPLGPQLRNTVYFLAENAAGFDPLWNGYKTSVAQTFTTSPLPTIAGTKKVGKTLTAATGRWNPSNGVTFSYVWSRADTNGGVQTPIDGATKKTYKLVAADKRKFITVSVTASKIGFADTVKTSAPGSTKIAG